MSRASRAWPLAAAGLLPLAALGWWLSVGRMDGMDAGPTSELGTFGWFAATWLVMMAAMMLPAITPAVASACFGQRARPVSLRPLLATLGFVLGYLAVWALAGAAVYGVLRAGRSLAGSTFEWHNGGQWLAAGVIALAGIYQLTPAKRGSLARCRAPLVGAGELPVRRLDQGARGGLVAGARCLASSWALMLVLFALGAMSLLWMVVVAGLIAAERLSSLTSPARVTVAAVLLALAVGVAAAPGSVPGLTVPGSPAAQQAMTRMDGMPAPARSMNH